MPNDNVLINWGHLSVFSTGVKDRIMKEIGYAVTGVQRFASNETGYYSMQKAKGVSSSTGEVYDDSTAITTATTIGLGENSYGIYFECPTGYTMRVYIYDFTTRQFIESAAIANGEIFTATGSRINMRFKREDGEDVTDEDVATISQGFKVFYRSYVKKELDEITSNVADLVSDSLEESIQTINNTIERAIEGGQRLANNSTGLYTITNGYTYANGSGVFSENAKACITGNSSGSKITIAANETGANYGYRFSCGEGYTMRLYRFRGTNTLDEVFVDDMPVTEGLAYDIAGYRIAIRFRREDGEDVTAEDAEYLTNNFKIFFVSYVDYRVTEAVNALNAEAEVREEALINKLLAGGQRKANNDTGYYTIEIGTMSNSTGENTSSTNNARTKSNINFEDTDKYATNGVTFECEGYNMRLYKYSNAGANYIESIPVVPGQIYNVNGYRIKIRFRHAEDESATITNSDVTEISENFKIFEVSAIEKKINESVTTAISNIDLDLTVTNGFEWIDLTDDFPYTTVSERNNVPQTSYRNLKTADIYALFDQFTATGSATAPYVTKKTVATYYDQDETERIMYEYTFRAPRSYSAGQTASIDYDPNRLNVVLVCGVHGREKITPYAAYSFCKRLFDLSSPISKLFTKMDIHVIPVVNQYGFDLWSNSVESNWNNARANSWGINLNRQFVVDNITESDFTTYTGTNFTGDNYPTFNYVDGNTTPTDVDGRPNPTSEDEVPEVKALKRYLFRTMQNYKNVIYVDMHMTTGSRIFFTSVFPEDRYRCLNMLIPIGIAWKSKYNQYMYETGGPTYELVREPVELASSYYVGNTYPNVVSAATMEICGTDTSFNVSPYSLTSKIATQCTTELYHWLKMTVEDWEGSIWMHS